mgnify:CR=1 FL=1
MCATATMRFVSTGGLHTILAIVECTLCQVLHPIGWDAFGLPAENAAVERGSSPGVCLWVGWPWMVGVPGFCFWTCTPTTPGRRSISLHVLVCRMCTGDWTQKNIAHMRMQLESLGISFDWDKEVTTCAPDYYKWTQWIFLRMHEAGLAYQKEASVNWDPVDKTVLANEQVSADGKSWRSGAVVEKRMMKQWFLRITEYADELLESIHSLDEWPENVKMLQRNWIGQSKGMTLRFPLQTGDGRPVPGVPAVEVFTTRPDTLCGVSFVAVAPTHASATIAQDASSGVVSESDAARVRAYVEESRLATTVSAAWLL